MLYEVITREGNYFLNRRFAGHEHDQPVKPGRDSAVGRGPVLERLGDRVLLDSSALRRGAQPRNNFV